MSETAVPQQEAPPPAPQPPDSAPPPPTSENRCTFDVREFTFERVLDRYVRSVADREIEVPPEVRDTRVTLKVRRIPWRSALEELARRIDCAVKEDGALLRVVKLTPEELEERSAVAPPWPWQWAPREAGPGTVTLDVRDQPLDAVLEPVRRASGLNIVISAELHECAPRLSLEVSEVPWQQALLTIACRVDGIVRVINGEYLRIERNPPDPRTSLARDFWTCDREGGRYRAAEKKGDAAGMADAKRLFRPAMESLERRIREFPEGARTAGESDDAFSDRNLNVLRRILQRQFGDLLQEK
jgi:hypothetical protein